jgi:hypothetical protein
VPAASLVAGQVTLKVEKLGARNMADGVFLAPLLRFAKERAHINRAH